MFDPLLFIAEHEGMSLLDAIRTAYEEGSQANNDNWTPVEKDLPSNHQVVFVTCKAAGRKNWVAQTTYRGSWDIPMVNRGESEVIAWMPFTIPAPYGGNYGEDQTE